MLRARILTLSVTLPLQVYGEASVGSEVGLHEHSTLEPTNPYSAAKAGAEMMVRALGLGFVLG